MPAAWITLPSPRGRTAFLGNNLDRGAPAGQWRLFTSLCSMRLMRSSAVSLVTPGRTPGRVRFQWTGGWAARLSQAARDPLSAQFPSQAPTFNAYLAQDLAAVRNAQQRANGIDLGQR